jgi:hypothetical protein
MLLAHLVTGRYRDGSVDEPYTQKKAEGLFARILRLLVPKR